MRTYRTPIICNFIRRKLRYFCKISEQNIPLSDNTFRIWVVFDFVFLNDLLAGVGVAIDAEVAAGVVHADVLAHHATTEFALPFVFHLFGRQGRTTEIHTEQGILVGQFAVVEVVEQILIVRPEAFHQFAVDATVVGDAILVEVDLFAAGGKLQVPALIVPAVAAFSEAVGNLVHLCLGELRLFDRFLRELVGLLHEVGLYFAVTIDVDEAKDKFVGQSFELVAEIPHLHQQVTRRELRGDDERVETPDDTFLTDTFGQFTEGLYPLRHAGHVWFEVLIIIVVEGELEVVVDTPLIQLMQQRNQRTRVLCPEHHHPTVLERHVGWLLVERVVPHAVARPQTVDEPLGIEGGNIGGATGGEDDGGGGFNEFAGLYFYGEFIEHGKVEI